MRPEKLPAAREVVMRRADDVHVVIEPRAIGVELAGQVYGVCAETIRRMQDEEGFPCVRIGTRRLVPVAAADAWFAARALRDTLPPSAAVASRQADELAAAALGSGESSAAAGFDVLAKQREWGDLVPSNADDEITDAEVVDDELLALEERIRADGRQFGLDPARYLIAVRAQCEGDRQRMADCSAKVRAEQLIPLSFDSNGRVQWGRPR